jgi:DNA polymerase-3 subunit delta'
MALRPVIGHRALRAGLAAAWLDDRLPASLLLQGRRGVGKQRLALWLGALMVCERVRPERLVEPCGECQGCRYAARAVHPDLHWYFPRPRLTGDPSSDDVAADLSEAIAERIAHDGLWSAPPGSDGLHVATVRALLHQATLRPAMAKHALFVVGDAERMVSQEGADQAANAFLKLLEEPPPSTSIVMTTSEPGALLPTIRSRVVTVRVSTLGREEMEEFLNDVAVHRRLGTTPPSDALARANGAPGELLSGESTAASFAAARRLLDAALQPASPAGVGERLKVAARLGVAGARGSFSDTLEALSVLLGTRVRELVAAGRNRDARRTASAMSLVEGAKLRARGNVSPQLLGMSLLQGLHRALRP